MQTISLRKNLEEVKLKYESLKIELVRMEGMINILQQFTDLGADTIELNPKDSTEVIDNATPTVRLHPK